MRNLFRLIARNYFILLFLLLEVISFVLIFQYNPFQKSFIINVSKNISTTLNYKISKINDYFYLQDENIKLQMENSYLRNRIENLRTTVYVNLPSKDTSMLSDSVSFKRYFYLPAEVVNSSINKQYNYITINKGSNQQLEKNMAVISGQGVVGMVLSTSNNFASIQPLINRNSKLGAKIQGKDNFGMLEWDGRNPGIVQLKEIPVHVSIAKGDTIVTSGYSSIYPGDLPVGVIEDYDKGDGNFYNINLRLFIDFRKLNHVLVVKNFKQKEQQELEKSNFYD